MNANPQVRKRRAGGRPRKYEGSSRPVTLTLPETTLRGLETIDRDRGQAIVKLTEAALGQSGNARPLVEIVEMAANTGLIVTGPSLALRSIPFLHLVEVAPGRYLLAMDSGHDFKSLELAIRDVFDDLPPNEAREVELLKQLLARIKDIRQSDRVSMAEILFVRLD